MITLTRPLVVFDLETTGLNIETDRIIEIGAVKLMPDGQRETKSTLVNPQISIPEPATAVHSITSNDVEGAPTFRALSKSLRVFFEGCDIGGYNVLRFDVPLLAAEFDRCRIVWPAADVQIVDGLRVWQRKEPRRLADAVRRFSVQEHGASHRAESDALDTLAVLESQAKVYDLGSIKDFDPFVRDPSWIDRAGKLRREDDRIVITFGRHAGASLVDVPRKYLGWVLKQTFDPAVKTAVQGEIDRRDQPMPEQERLL